MDARSYSRYQHTLKMAYRQQLILETDISKSFPPYFSIAGISPHSLVAELAKGSRDRLNMLKQPKGHLISEDTSVRTLSCPPYEILIPIINQQGSEWYGASPPSNFDFLVESQLGLLDGAKVIYDFGTHHGVWSMYYALVAGAGGRVVCFEPSIINVEVSALLFLINGANNIVNIGAAIGAGPDPAARYSYAAGFSEAAPSSGMLVDFVSGDLPVVDLRDAAWEHADFLKMDIEGFEYDVITRNPWIFDLATNMHIEVHIPHLIHRGLNYRDIIDLIPFDQFTILNYQNAKLVEIQPTTPLSGLCSLMMKRRQTAMTA